ncbi:hypothetical protein ANTQUA_LOCUS10385 [Anthophora quadrimaculata]
MLAKFALLRQNYGHKDAPREQRTRKEPTLYTCSGCKYASKRQFNVERHRIRIHENQRLHYCCGREFLTKGDYYLHCEQRHPRKRMNTFMSRLKYKIICDSNDNIREERENLTSNSYRLKLRSRITQKSICVDEYPEESQWNVRVKNSVTYSEIDIENIPLIRFLTDRRLKSHWRRLFSSGFVNKTEDKPMLEEEANQSMKIAISSGRNIEEAVSEGGGVESDRKKVSNTSTSSVSSSFSLELPAKKLLLHRFRTTSVMHECEVPLREQSNNNSNRMNFTERKMKDLMVPETRQSRARNAKHAIDKENKENVSAYMFSLEQQLNIKLDTGITVPDVSQLHRDFLASIDFENYKLF